jgi:hypothetical protein
MNFHDENSKRPKQVNPKPMKTKIIQKILVSLTAGFGALLAATTAHAQSLVAFDATSHQNTIVSIVCNGDVCDIVFEGTGTVNIMGPVTVTSHVVQDMSGYPCDPGTAEVTYVGASGSITTSYAAGWVCPSATRSGFPYTIQGVWSVTGGTGQFSGIIGSGADQGTINPEGHGPTVHSTGVVVY